ncbi:CsbD family protein [Acidisoma silvae]|uniref:CsbD family protein n=1 Tax=Acidisoma silvae TaxID=2802396 RepID=A0A963YP84_9PROT|nr:CsbD family protein [Acidisoma silvae]MCB8874089.1 CsbD family protein [Acidisoma silvae]
MNQDHVEGAFSEAKGTIKEGIGNLTGDAKTEAEGKVDQFAGRAQQTWGDARDAIDSAAATAAEAVSEAASHAPGKFRDTAESVKATASQVGSKVYEAGSSAGQTIASTVKEQPLLSLIGVAAIGYLAGYLLHSPSSPFTAEPEPRYRRAIRRWS